MVFIATLTFLIKPLAMQNLRCIKQSLNHETCLSRPTTITLNTNELRCCTCVVDLDRCDES